MRIGGDVWENSLSWDQGWSLGKKREKYKDLQNTLKHVFLPSDFYLIGRSLPKERVYKELHLVPEMTLIK